MNELAAHWDKAFEAPLENLGWYEADPQPMWDLVQAYAEKDHCIHIAGAGRSVLVKTLWEEGYQNLLLSDLSPQALQLLIKDNPEIPESYYRVMDLAQVWPPSENREINTWIDRAVLHFLITEKDRIQYFKNVKTMLSRGGRVIFGQFAIDGAKKCCGLDIHPYDTQKYQHYLGADFKLIEEFPFTYFNPKGDPRPYAYAVFEKL